MQVGGLIDIYYPLHVLLLDQVDNLAAVCDDFERLTGHDNLFVFKDLPVLEPLHDSRENLVEVLVDWAMLIAQLLGLI